MAMFKTIIRGVPAAAMAILLISAAPAEAHHYTQAEIDAAFERMQTALAAYSDATDAYNSWNYWDQMSAEDMRHQNAEAACYNVFQVSGSWNVGALTECLDSEAQENEYNVDEIEQNDRDINQNLLDATNEYMIAQANYQAMISH